MPKELTVKMNITKRHIPDPRKAIACYRLFRNSGHSIFSSIHGAYLMVSYEVEIDGLNKSLIADYLMEDE